MFGPSTSTANAAGATRTSHLVEFKAGRMNMIGKMVHPDARKGLVFMTKSEDGLMHFCWKDRTTEKVEDDLIIFPDDCELKRVDQCKTGRVYVLKFKNSPRRLFYWMQEPKEDRDEEYCRRVNELMNNPPSTVQRAGNAGTEGVDLSYMLNNVSQQQLMQLFGGVGQMGGLSSLLGSMNQNLSTPSATRISSARAPGASQANRAKPVESAPTSDATAGEGATTAKSTAGTTASGGAAVNDAAAAGSSRSLNVDLSTALITSDAVNEVVDNPANVRTLAVHLPKSVDANEKKAVKDAIASPQFQQALALFSHALQSAQLGPVISKFELTPEAVSAASAGNLEAFVEALEKALPAGTTMGALPGDKEGSPKKDNPDGANKGV